VQNASTEQNTMFSNNSYSSINSQQSSLVSSKIKRSALY